MNKKRCLECDALLQLENLKNDVCWMCGASPVVFDGEKIDRYSKFDRFLIVLATSFSLLYVGMEMNDFNLDVILRKFKSSNQSNCDERAVREFAITRSLLGGGEVEIIDLQSLENDKWIVKGSLAKKSPISDDIIQIRWTLEISCERNQLVVVDAATEIIH